MSRTMLRKNCCQLWNNSTMATTKKRQPARSIKSKTPMSPAHKAALAQGREEGRIVRSYLDALEEAKPRRGRKRTPDSIKRRLVAIDGEIDGAGTLHRLHLIQERTDLEDELQADVTPVDIEGLQKGFVKVAASYGERKGLSYSTWRAVGVSAPVLKKAGIARSRG
jgi:hypothetical protein